MDQNMENRKSLLNLSSIEIIPNLSIRIPTIGEILEDEQHYYNLISSITATPFQYMVQLDDMGIDFTTISDYQLFMMLFPVLANGDIRILFGDIDLSDMKMEINSQILYSKKNNIIIDEFVYSQIADSIRKINSLKKDSRKPGNNEAKEFRIKLERKKQKRNAKKPYEAYLEKLVVALVNRADFKYNYNQVNDLTIYQFNQSFEQLKTNINYNNTMIGVYAGTVDISKLKDKSSLSWLKI